MYQNYKYGPNFQPNYINQKGQDRFIGGGFLGPFLLGGLTGGLIAPAFYNNYGYNRPPYYYNNYYYVPYPYYYR